LTLAVPFANCEHIPELQIYDYYELGNYRNLAGLLSKPIVDHFIYETSTYFDLTMLKAIKAPKLTLLVRQEDPYFEQAVHRLVQSQLKL
jgi:hypothetical protein